MNLSPGLVEANVGEPHLLRGKNWSEREEVRIIVTIVMTIFKRGGEDHRDNYDDNCDNGGNDDDFNDDGFKVKDLCI